MFSDGFFLPINTFFGQLLQADLGLSLDLKSADKEVKVVMPENVSPPL